jgi:hypothetical protein
MTMRAIWRCWNNGWPPPRGRLPAAIWWRKSRGSDQHRLAPVWAELSRARGARSKGRTAQPQPAKRGRHPGAIADNRAQLDQTFEARQSRMADELARVAMERLFASAPDLGTLVHG